MGRSEGTADDTERYHYADGGTRTRKIHSVQVSGGMQTTVTTYAGGCEIRQRLLDGQPDRQKHIVITEGGGMRLVENKLSGEACLRYRFSDHLNSSGGETDEEGRVTSREEYAPYGGTVGEDEDAAEVSNLTQRTYRYSGKERDFSEAGGIAYPVTLSELRHIQKIATTSARILNGSRGEMIPRSGDTAIGLVTGTCKTIAVLLFRFPSVDCAR